jgi:DNA-binding XRE family transcriptional regulator
MAMTALHGSRRTHRKPNLMLKELRINRGLSPNELAHYVGVTGKTIRMAEAGFVPTPRVQFNIAQYFDLRPTDIWPLQDKVAA